VSAALVGLVALGQLHFSVCPFANLTGHPCPGCGLTRAALSLMRLDFAAALRLHPLSPLLVPIAAGMALDAARRYVLDTPTRSPWMPELTPRQSAWFFGLLSGLMLVVWCARALGYLGGPAEVHPAVGWL
jgi:hypothetical protein